MPPSFRERDMRVEREVAKFLDRYLYPHVCESSKRIGEKEEQLKGKDILVKFPDRDRALIVDEKAATRYINKDIPTFAFEIGFFSGDNHIEGWLIDESKETELYLCAWIRASHDEDIWMEDILELDCVLVLRQALLQYLSSLGLSREMLVGFEADARSLGQEGKHIPHEYPDIHFFLSLKYAERPYNVIFHRQLLENLAWKSWRVTKTGVVPLQNVAKHYRA